MKNIIKIIILLTVTPLLWLIGHYAGDLDVQYPMNTYKEKRNEN